ncbi:DsbA family protein [Roseobacter sp. YSTF-M11]|uniref:DsbA family protein n=1 Tax=Roseobacter insulae TaxID=2859783 RepID=A0A9X1FWP5_9RHOB|nr:DsbA family protein [Roseobacter insulae]MBW4708692.1 DsbA family protein [Roseobacter insulae]
MLKNLILSGVIGAFAFAGPTRALDLETMSDEERAIFRAEVRAYLLDNPEVIMEAVRRLEERQAAAQEQADFTLVADNAEAIFNDGFSFVGGNPDGDITLVEFMDYRCGFCKRAYGEVEKLLESDGNIRFVVKEFPILGEQSTLASRYVIAAKQVAGDEAYKALHDALMVFNGDITLPALRRLATTYGLDSQAIENVMDDESVTQEIAATRALAQKLQITGTPTFVLHDEMLRGFLPYDQMRAILEEKRDL